MAELVFKAFFSTSFADEDRELREFFTKLVHAFDIEPLIYDYQEIGRVSDKVKEHILRCDCLIALATRKFKIEGTDYWACGDWIQHELAIAHAFKKPIAIFIEDGVKIEGLLGIEERRERFNRHALLDNIPKVVRFLYGLRNYLEQTYQSQTLQVPLLLRHYIHAKEELISKDVATLRCEIMMESLIEELGSTDHTMELDETTPGLSIKPMKFDFVAKEVPEGITAEAVVIQNTDAKFTWKIDFNPPLRKGDKVRYAFKVVRPNYRPFTYEEMMRRIEAGTYEYKEPICEACEWYISYPTAELKFDFEFPEGYEITNFYPDVRVGETVRLKAEGETKRIKEGGFFSAEKMFDRWTLSLVVPKPMQNHLYYTYYEPPRAATIKSTQD